mmetsp:Transcript_43578/g.120573  ORF Transcript_43578/g.120573 Transcript_43578/m.120573 type:complete len:188 (+) Transcript_43578:98-661(+)
MGSLASRLEDRQRNAALAARIADARQQKHVRDVQQSMQVALVRDRVLWITTYYATVLCVSGLRHLIMHRRGVRFTFDNFFLPLNVVVVLIPPFALGYQLDFVHASKANRVAEEAARIRAGDPHHWFGHPLLPVARRDAELWFNQPLLLPAALQPAYRKYMADLNKAQRESGQPEFREWAKFSETSSE